MHRLCLEAVGGCQHATPPVHPTIPNRAEDRILNAPSDGPQQYGIFHKLPPCYRWLRTKTPQEKASTSVGRVQWSLGQEKKYIGGPACPAFYAARQRERKIARRLFNVHKTAMIFACCSYNNPVLHALPGRKANIAVPKSATVNPELASFVDQPPGLGERRSLLGCFLTMEGMVFSALQ